MKTSFSLLPVILAFLLLISFESTQAQLLKRIRNEVKSRAENKIVNKAGDTVEKLSIKRPVLYKRTLMPIVKLKVII